MWGRTLLRPFPSILPYIHCMYTVYIPPTGVRTVARREAPSVGVWKNELGQGVASHLSQKESDSLSLATGLLGDCLFKVHLLFFLSVSNRQRILLMALRLFCTL